MQAILNIINIFLLGLAFLFDIAFGIYNDPLGISSLIFLIVAIACTVIEFLDDEGKYKKIYLPAFYVSLALTTLFTFIAGLALDNPTFGVLAVFLLIDFVAYIITSYVENIAPSLTAEEENKASRNKEIIAKLKQNQKEEKIDLMQKKSKTIEVPRRCSIILFNIGSITCSALLSIAIVPLICILVELFKATGVKDLLLFKDFKVFLVIVLIMVISIIINLYCMHINTKTSKRNFVIAAIVYNFVIVYLTIVASILLMFYNPGLLGFVIILYTSIVPLISAAVLYLIGILQKPETIEKSKNNI